jgi:hypothetical protein
MQKCREKDRQRYIKTDVHIYIQSNRNKDVQTYTDKQTDRRTVQKCWNRLKNRHMYRKTNIHTYCTPTVLYIRQTNRQDRQKRMTIRSTNRMTVSI